MGQQNTTLIFRHLFKYEKMKLFPAVSYLNPMAVRVRTQSGKQQFHHFLFSAGDQVTLTGQIFA
jgi:hypothetical protein